MNEPKLHAQPILVLHYDPWQGTLDLQTQKPNGEAPFTSDHNTSSQHQSQSTTAKSKNIFQFYMEA